jgi:hypothetical protein
MEIPWTGPNFKWKFHGKAYKFKIEIPWARVIFTRKFHGKG